MERRIIEGYVGFRIERIERIEREGFFEFRIERMIGRIERILKNLNLNLG